MAREMLKIGAGMGTCEREVTGMLRIERIRKGSCRRSTRRTRIALVVSACLGLAFASGSALADTIIGRVEANATFEQTSNSAPTSASGYWLGMGADFSTAGDFTSGAVTYPGSGSPQALSPSTAGLTGASVSYQSGIYASLSALHADYPFGTYSITATGPAGTQTANLDYTADYFTSDVPYVTNFGSLAGSNPESSIAFYFPGFTPNATNTDSFTSLTVYDAATSSVVYSQAFLTPDTTGLALPADLLSANTAYTFELVYDGEIDGFDAADGTFTAQLSDMITGGSFTTGAATPVPEPAALGMFGFGALLIGVLVGMRRRLA